MPIQQKTSAFLNRRMRFWDPLGGRQEFSIQTFLNVIQSPAFLLFGGLTLVLFFATDPSSNRPYVPLWASAAIWPMAYVLYMTLYLICLSGVSILTGYATRLRVPTPMIGFVALLPTVYISEVYILDWMSGGTYPPSLQGKYLFYFLSVQVSEAVFYKYIFPNMGDLESAEDLVDSSAPTEPSRYLIIGGERIPLSSIHLIEAREHHVHVTLSDSRRRLRARLRDIVAQTTSEDGVQTHRSWWVARHAAKELCEEGGRPVLRLTDNAHIPVARTRIGEVKDWVDQHLYKNRVAPTAAE
jgi:hypothetical protein